MRNAFASEITKIAKNNKKIVLLSGDIGNRLFDNYKIVAKDRFINCGVAEQNMTGVAAGLAIAGFQPITYTIAPFCTTRCLEQIKIDVAYHNLPVIIISVGAGLSYAGLGPTHHSCEDLSFLNSIPNMNIICPADPLEVRYAVREAIKLKKPTYIRLGKKGEPYVHKKKKINFKFGKMLRIKKGKHVCLLSTGNILPVVLEIEKKLTSLGINAEVVNSHTIKPIDKIGLKRIFNIFKYVFSIEEHSKIGGLGSIISSWIFENQIEVKHFKQFGTDDVFFKKSGSQNYARSQLGLSSDLIFKEIKKIIKK